MDLFKVEFVNTTTSPIRTKVEYFSDSDEEKPVEVVEFDNGSTKNDNDDRDGDGGDSDFDSYTARCGEILVSNRGQFTLVCIFCDEKFSKFQLFASHMQKDHLDLGETEKVVNKYHNTTGDSLDVKSEIATNVEISSKDVEPGSKHIAKPIDVDVPRGHVSKQIEADVQSYLDLIEYDEDYSCGEDDYDEVIDPDKQISNDSTSVENNNEKENRPNGSSNDYLNNFRNFLEDTATDRTEENQDTNNKDTERIVSNSEDDYNPSEIEDDDSDSWGYQNVSSKSKKERNIGTVIECEICGRKYTTMKGYESHRKRHEIDENSDGGTENPTHSTKQSTSLKCKYCSKQFIDRSRRIEHERTHTGEQPFQCDLCDKRFRVKRQQMMHMLTHTGEKRFKCQYCGTAFASRTNLAVHIRIHLKDFRYSCDFCGKPFIRNVDRRIHMRCHTGEKPYQCELCGENFSTCSKLTEHKKRHTNTRPFSCETCGKNFFSKALMQSHMVIHTNERPFQCDICFATFPRHRALRNHQKIHSLVKEYVCDICHKRFAQRAGLYCHMRRHGIMTSKRDESEQDF